MSSARPTRKVMSDSIYAYETKQCTRYCFKFRDAAGKQTTRRGFLTRREARVAREQVMGKVHSRQIVVSRATLASWWEIWLAGRKPYLEPGTLQSYGYDGTIRILPHLGHRKLTAITAPEIRQWLVELAGSGRYKPKTLNNTLTTLTVCLNQAVADGLIPMNPASFVRRLPLGHVERDYLRLAEIPVYLAACSEQYRILAETLIGTGVRIGEAVALTAADVDIERSAVIVARSVKGDGSVGSTKSDRFRRVEIGPQLCARLGELIARRREQTDAAPQETLLFVQAKRRRTRERGPYELAPVNKNTVSRDWHPQALRDAGLRHMSLHSLRHTAAAAWLSTGRPLMFVQRQLGHAQITTTEGLYGHLEEAFVRSGAAETEAAIWRRPS